MVFGKLSRVIFSLTSYLLLVAVAIPARILRTYVEKPLIAISLARYHPDEPPSEIPFKLQWVEGVNNMITGKRVHWWTKWMTSTR